MQAHGALLAREASRIQKLLGASGIVVVLRDVGFGGPVIRGQDTGGELCLTLQEIADERFAVRRRRESLANFVMRQDRILEIEAQVREIRSAAVAHREIRLAREDRNDVGRKRAHLQIGRTFAKFEGANNRIWHDSESHTSDLRHVPEIFRIAFDDHLFVLRFLHEAKRAGADGMS